MAHHRKVRTSSKMENKRIDHKKVRQATDQAIRGGNSRTVRSDRWGKLDQPPASDIIPHRKSRKNRKKWCKGRVGVPHKPVYGVYRKYSSFNLEGWICENCGRHMWGYRPSPPSSTKLAEG